jgi:hypothetical protein
LTDFRKGVCQQVILEKPILPDPAHVFAPGYFREILDSFEFVPGLIAPAACERDKKKQDKE